MKLAIGADHRGFALKEALKALLVEDGYEVEDVGAREADPSDDYPQYAYPVGMLVASGEAERGILVCGSGVGMAIAANKVAGIRAAEGFSLEHARAARADDDANVLTLGGMTTSLEDAHAMARVFLETEFSHAPRHERRLDEIVEIEHDERRESSHE